MVGVRKARRSSQHRPTVDAEDLTGDETGFLRAQEAHGRGDVVAGAEVPQGDGRGHLLVRRQVSGLLTGQDIRRQLEGKPLGEKLLLPCNLLRSGEEVFLDDMTLGELEKALQVPVHIVKSDGQSLFDEMNG